MEYYQQQTDKLLKDVEKSLKEYCEKMEDPDCFGGRLRFIIDPCELYLSQVSNAMENLNQVVYFGRLIMFTLTPSPMFGQKMPFFKVEFGPAFNNFINPFPCQKYKPVRAGMSRDLFLIHIKSFVRIQCSGLFRFQNRYHEASSRLKRHGVSLCYRIQNNPPILFWPLERIYNH